MKTENQPSKKSESDRNTKEKICLVSKQFFPREKMLRFTVFDEKTVVFDMAGKLPGRGIWIKATPEAVQQAIDKKLFSKGAKCGVNVPPDLINQITQTLKKRCLSLISFARKIGILHNGFEAVKKAVVDGSVRLVFEASDGSQREQNRLFRETDPFVVCRAFSRDELGQAIGMEEVVHIVLTNHPLTNELTELVEKMMPFLDMKN